ncbi:hypothetical protein LLG90_12040 [Aromatoleum toluclasticum]|uniref:hypothetical protein n=1 Tax=Aromatoleum toluclasticum TaxID=92003 RepID=UPI001D1936D1|nr:hypothetical protein [Aromatoleum toluclasticum]MCC4116081.1 hypothetical protein [Aromatoleum toluclasticum]
MQIHLVVPGLIWPAASAISPASGLELTSLAWLLGQGRRGFAPFEPLDAQLARLMGYPVDEGALPLAALRRLGEPALPAPAAAASWLCADPVNLSFAREHLLLNEFPAGELGPEDVAALIAALNDTFGDLGSFEAATSNRWYLRLAAPARTRFFPLHDVVGRPVRDFLPEGEDARLWQRTMNELQIVLHNHPVNQAREAAGHRPANSLWFWGAGLPRPAQRSAARAIQADDPLMRGFALAAGCSVAAPDCTTALDGDALVVLDDLLLPARHLDIESWRTRLAKLEHGWFAPLAAALRGRRLRTLKITAPGDRGTLELEVRAADTWKFWRKPLSLDTLLKSIAPAVASPPGAPADSRPPQHPGTR